MKATVTSRSYDMGMWGGELGESLNLHGYSECVGFELSIKSTKPLNIPKDADIEMEITLKVTPKQTTLVKTFK